MNHSATSSTSTSKTSDKNWIKERVQAYWRLSAASVTAFARRYRSDIFYRTGWNVVLIQVGFTVVLIGVTLFAISYFYQDLVDSLVNGIKESLLVGTATLDSYSIATTLEYAKERAMVFLGTAVLVLAAVFGWLIARIALAPTRNALTSQKQFVGNIAHELRTPLSIIKTNTEVLLMEDGGNGARETHESNLEELDRISDIINNLLSMNALITPQRIDFANVDLGLIVDKAVASLAELTDHKTISIDIRKSEYRTVWGNISALEQIVMNVLKNALNYSSSGTNISVAIEPTYGGQIETTIEDRGTGISGKDLEHIFEPFYRGDRSRNRKSGGSGLGLAIVSELVKLHKGKIAIRSTVGRGTAVSILLPSGKRTPKPASIAPDSHVEVDFS